MDNNKEISLIKYYNNILNENDINIYDNRRYILSEYKREINPKKKINVKNINNKLNQRKKKENQKISENTKIENNFKPIFFSTFNIQNKTNYNPQREKKLNNRIIKNHKNMNIRVHNGIIKSEPNLFKSKSIDINKNIIYKEKENTIKDDFSDISEIKKMDYSFEEQNINPDDLFSQENSQLFDEKKVEIKKIMNEYPELIYTEIYKNFSKYQNLKIENCFLKSMIKKLNIEIKDKMKLIDEFTELFNQSKIKFQEIILKNKKSIQEIEEKNNLKINELNQKIKKLEEENNALIKRNKILLNNINGYDKYLKLLEEKNQKIYSNYNKFNKINEYLNNVNKKVYGVTTTRGSSSTLNSRINRYHNNYSKNLKSLFDNKENILNNKNIQNNFKEDSLNIQHKAFLYNITENNFNINNKMSKNYAKSNSGNNIVKDFRDSIKKVKRKDIIKKRGNSVGAMKINSENSYNFDKIIIK